MCDSVKPKPSHIPTDLFSTDAIIDLYLRIMVSWLMYDRFSFCCLWDLVTVQKGKQICEETWKLLFRVRIYARLWEVDPN
jgi:hypothetical protein